jgi:hypothetical protein
MKKLVYMVCGISLVVSLLILVSCSTTGTTKAKKIDITTTQGAHIKGEGVELGQDFMLIKDAEGNLTVGFKTTSYHVQINAQDRAALLELGKLAKDGATDAVAAYLTSGGSQALAVLQKVAKQVEVQDAQRRPE